MDYWITQFGVQTEKICLCENHRCSPGWLAGLAGRPKNVRPAWNLSERLPPSRHGFGDSPIEPQHPGLQPKDVQHGENGRKEWTADPTLADRPTILASC